MSPTRPALFTVRLLGTLFVLAAGLAVFAFVRGAGTLPGGPYVVTPPERMDPLNVERLERALADGSRPRRLDVSFLGFRQDAGRDYVVVAASSREGPVHLHVRVLDWDGTLRRLRDTGGYRHARLRGFEWDVATLDGRRELVYRTMQSVVD